MADNDVEKKPLKYVEMALNKFKDVAIPYNINLLKEQKLLLQQVKQDPNITQNLEINITRAEAQLKNLLYELDTLRMQVQESDLDKFDKKNLGLRDSILHMIYEYKEMRQSLIITKPVNHENLEDNEEVYYEPKQLIISDDLAEIKIKESELRLRNVEKIHNDIEDLHCMYGDLNQIVNEQGEMLNHIDTNVQITHENTSVGFRHLVSASRLKTSAYPVAGAVIGGIVGGPLGLLAGIKVGGLAALSCCCLGYMGGKVLKKQNNNNNKEQKLSDNSNSDQPINSHTATNKKND